MESDPLSAADEALLSHAVEVNDETVDTEFFDGAHVVAASVRTADGELFDGVSLPTSIGRASVCAEPVAIGSAIAAGYSHDDVEACVAVSYPMPDHQEEWPRVIPPCGVCRELLADYNSEMRVVIPGTELDADGERVVHAGDLLPSRPW